MHHDKKMSKSAISIQNCHILAQSQNCFTFIKPLWYRISVPNLKKSVQALWRNHSRWKDVCTQTDGHISFQDPPPMNRCRADNKTFSSTSSLNIDHLLKWWNHVLEIISHTWIGDFSSESILWVWNIKWTHDNDFYLQAILYKKK